MDGSFKFEKEFQLWDLKFLKCPQTVPEAGKASSNVFNFINEPVAVWLPT